MAVKYPLHKILIRDKVFDLGNDIIIDENLDDIFMSGSVSLPKIESETWSTLDLKKYDVLKIYFKFFDSEEERQTATIDDMKLIFDGYIDTLPVSEDKSSGINYNGLSFKSTIALLWERTAPLPFTSLPVLNIINLGLEYTELQFLIPSIEYDANIPDYFVPKIDSTKYFGNVLEQLRQKYAIHTYQKGDGSLVIKFPSSFYGTDRPLYEYDLQTNIFNIDYGDIAQKVDCVCVLGMNCVGVAFDPIAYNLKQGLSPDGEVVEIDKTKLNPLYIVRRDVFNREEAQLLAREKLVELAKNYAITFSCVYEPDQQIGDMFVIKNSSVIDENQKWIIKSRAVELNKTNISCSISAYSNSIQDLPEDLLLSATGILDTDILEITDREIMQVVLQ